MPDPSQFENLAKKLFTVLPANMQIIENEVQQQFKEILSAAFASMDLLTREEFDVQANVLARTREKVETLQKCVDQLLEAR